jgi:GTPase SAR1 family protein
VLLVSGGEEMQANIEMHEGRAALQRILSQFPAESPHWSEAQNRFQFIDRLLTECLGWEQPYIEVETFDDAGGRADYLLGKPIRAALEAKKEAKKFKFLPTSRLRGARKLRPLIEACSVLKAACSQVISYSALHGARLSVVCNGPQMVLFGSTGQGASPLDADCFVFDGFGSYVDSFANLWRFLSPEGIYENVAVRTLSDLQNPRVPAKAATVLGEAKAYRYRTPFQENLRTLATVLLEDVEYNPQVKSDFYKECYVSVYGNDENSLLDPDLLSARYKRVSDNGVLPANLTTKVDGGVVKLNAGEVITTTGRPIVVVGDVGVGKTSFFEHLFQRLDNDERAKTCYVHVNLGEEASLSVDVKSYFLKIVPIVLKEEYGINIDSSDFATKLYDPELGEFEEGVEAQLKNIDESSYIKARIAYLTNLIADRASHVKRALNFIVRAYGMQVMIVLDNADQRTFNTQQEAFLVAQELAASRTMLIFVALRPSTFYASKLSGALSGYKNEVLSISPPPAHEVIRKRIVFALRVAEGRVAPAALEGVSLNLSNVVLFLTAMLASIRKNPDIRTFLGNITGGNTRLILELITSFCGSPNVESERIVRIQEEANYYQVPLHEFTKHALLGEYAYYNSTSSLVACNVFDVAMADKREHFLALLIIGFLTSPTGLRDNDGFVPGALVLSEMMRNAFVEGQVRVALKRLAEHRLIETPHAHFREIEVKDDELAEAFYYRATSVGIYHARHWIGGFSFLDAMCLDTPIFDEEKRSIVFKHASSFEIKDRLKKASAFLSYLESVWYDANFDVNYFDFQAAVHDQKGSFESVRRVVQRAGKHY